MRLSKFNTADVLDNLRTFSYTETVDGETVTKNVTLFPSSQTPMVNRLFLQSQGRLRADDIMFDYKRGDITAETLAGVIMLTIKERLVQLWKVWEADYNPLWNVDAYEKRSTVTERDVTTDHEKDTTLTDEQKTDGKNNVTHGHTLQDSQTADGKNNTTHGHTLSDAQTVSASYNTAHTDNTEHSEPTTTSKVSAFDSGSNYVNAAQSTATNHSDSNAGTGQGTSSMGTIMHTEGGTTNTALSMGTILHTEGGTTNTSISMGKITHKTEGKDTDKEDFDENLTDTFIRHGNIGVTMSTQLIADQINVWSKFSFFEEYFNMIAEQITIPIYDEEDN